MTLSFNFRSRFKARIGTVRIGTVNCPYSSRSSHVGIVATLLVLVMSVTLITVVRSVTVFLSGARNTNGNILSNIRDVINARMVVRLVMFGPYSSRSNAVRIAVAPVSNANGNISSIMCGVIHVMMLVMLVMFVWLEG